MGTGHGNLPQELPPATPRSHAIALGLERV